MAKAKIRDLAFIEEIFTEWMTRWRDHPEEFEDIVTILLKEDSATYGQKAATYFLYLYDQLRPKP
jgi:hypothetical protein